MTQRKASKPRRRGIATTCGLTSLQAATLAKIPLSPPPDFTLVVRGGKLESLISDRASGIGHIHESRLALFV
jgi:hypothetical protein